MDDETQAAAVAGRRRRYRIAAIVASSLIGLLLAEVALRVRDAQTPATRVLRSAALHEPDADVGYTLRAGRTADCIHVNALGLRGAEVALDAPPGTRRVLCIGDSITWGQAASADDRTYPTALERALRRDAACPAVQVLNGGVGGYGSRQCLHRLRALQPALRPDFVLVLVGWNDLTFGGWRGWHPEMTWVTPPDVWSLRESFLLEVLRKRLTPWGPGINERAVAAYRTNVRALVDAAHSAGAGVALVDLPTVFGPEMSEEATAKARINGFRPSDVQSFLAYRDALRSVAAAQHVPLLRTGLEYEVEGKVPLLVDVCHPDDAGNERMARTLAPQVAALLLRRE